MHVQWWIYFPSQWKLEDVQAGLVVCVSLLAFIAVFTSARCFWHTSAKRISREADVPISSLLSFTTLGEAFDVVVLLKTKLLRSKHFALLFQCLLVIGFSACAIFAGPISRYATRTGLQDGLVHNKGLLASQSYLCELNNVIQWHNVSQSLEKASFPYDQLLDFLPDTRSDWVYHADDWNSTWKAKCSITTEANITLEAKGNYTYNDMSDWDNIPGLKDVLSARYLSDKKNTLYNTAWSGNENDEMKTFTDLIYYTWAEYHPDGYPKSWAWNRSSATQRMSVHLSSIGMLGVPRYQKTKNSSIDWYFGKGSIPNAWYTKVECDLSRNLPADKVSYWQANMDLRNCPVAQQMDHYFSAQSNAPQADQSTQIKLPTGNELWRFFQAFSISKDTHFPHPVDRLINQRLPTVQISTLFLAVMSLVAIIVIFGLIYCLVCRVLYSELYKRIPETKVDWLLQSLREAQGSSGLGGGQAQSLAPSTIGGGDNNNDEKYYHQNNYAAAVTEKQKIPWEKARYSLANPHQSPAPSSGYNTPASTSPPVGLGKIALDRSQHVSPPSPAPPSLRPGTTSPSPSPSPSPYASPFTAFVNRTNGYSPLATPQPYTGASSPAVSFTSPPVSPRPMGGDRVVSYGLGVARAQPVVHSVGVGSLARSEKGEWGVGVVERR